MYFNPRLLRGRRLGNSPKGALLIKFQFSPPARDATPFTRKRKRPFIFQSTPPAREATSLWSYRRSMVQFQSSPPVGEATLQFLRSVPDHRISIHASREGDDPMMRRYSPRIRCFNPRLLRRRRLGAGCTIHDITAFQFTPPSREATGTGPCRRLWCRNFNPHLLRGR